MRASVLRGGSMVYRDDVPDPMPGPGQVLVAVKACGICGSDLHFAKHGEDMLAAGRQIEGMPDPTDTYRYAQQTIAMIQRYAARTDGHAFALFTNYDMMRRVAAGMARAEPARHSRDIGL